MSEAADQRSSGGSGAAWVTAMFVALVLYALSPAPVMKALVSIHGPVLPRTVEERFYAVYSPLKYAVEQVPSVEHFYGWYLDLWGL